MEVEAKFANFGDYSNDAIVDKVIEVLREYQDMFPMKFSNLKGLIKNLSVMEITLKPDAKLVKQRLYCLNPKYKEMVCLEFKMLVVGIIEPVEESEWVSPMVVQEKKQKDEIWIYIDLRKLNDACVHDCFATSFTFEVLDNVAS